MPTVDIIVPCYRYAHFLGECVNSILSQSLTSLRVLIIDDASPDETHKVAMDLVNSDSRVSVRRHHSNKGHIATYNAGIDWASADYMLLLSADDYILPGALHRAVSLMDSHPELGFTFGNALQLTADGITTPMTPIPRIHRKDSLGVFTGIQFIQMNGSRNIVPTPTALVRTALQKKIGGYRPDLPHAGDMEMWLRFAANAPVGFVDEFQAVYRKHDSNMNITYLTNGSLPDLLQRKKALDYVFSTCGDLIENSTELRDACLESLGKDAISCASSAFNEGAFGISYELSGFGLGVCPKLRSSVPWKALAIKRRVGIRVWNLVRPAFSVFRKFLSLTH